MSLPRRTTALVALLALSSCADPVPPTADPVPTTSTSAPITTVPMPDLVGLPEAAVPRHLARLERDGTVEASGDWRPGSVRCEAPPGTVVRQHPTAGTPVAGRVEVRLRVAALDLAAFRGPCPGEDLGPVTGPDAALARSLYRFAADPTLAAPFVPGEVWTGIEDGLASATVGASSRSDLGAWRIDTSYAERSGPFSALDVLASSGGRYELHRGVLPTCGVGSTGSPPVLAGTRALTLAAPPDTVTACLQWWGVTLFLDDADRVAGVALRLGAP